ncbi:MAG TPA: FAD-dependent oxidoreductase [Abditibacteriaceae bacterium]|jgi:glycine/D-amino acid oxidase-like deaminating enzyme/nitrite reductase/ring-hydroxylating ferredoxin subunit
MPTDNGFTDNGQTRSSWLNVGPPALQPLGQDVETDVCVVGAGISGLTTAYLLLKKGKRVAILDDGPIAGGDSCRTSAHLASELDDYYHEIENIFSEGAAKLVYESHSTAIDTIERISREENIDCDFVRLDGYLFTPTGEGTEELDTELEAAHRAGFADAEKIERAPLSTFDTGPCLRFPHQGQFHPLKYLAGLARCIERDGGKFYKAHAKNVEGGEQPHVETIEGNMVRASAIVVATNSPINDRLKIHTKQHPYRTYMVGLKITGEIPLGLYWDTLDPYHYARVQTDENILIVGGEDHKTGQEDDAEDRWSAIEEWTRERFPVGETVYRWSGQVMETVDGLAFIGHNNGENDPVYIATGDSGMGMTHGTIAGILLSDLICGRENPWQQIYDPQRKAVKAARDWVEENLNVAAQYVDLVTGGDVADESEIARGEGAIIRQGAKKIAVYCDDAGEFHRCSAICPHLGAVVQWNSAEKSWDCPAHGSRFRAEDGKPVNSPSSAPLAPVE